MPPSRRPRPVAASASIAKVALLVLAAAAATRAQQDLELPALTCPAGQLLAIASRTADGISLAANVSCDVYTNGDAAGAPTATGPGECIVTATDNVGVVAVSGDGMYLLPPGESIVSITVRDAAGQGRTCEIAWVVSTRSADAEILNFVEARAIASSDIPIPTNINAYIGLVDKVRQATLTLDSQHISNTGAFEDLAIAALRLAKHMPVDGTTLSARTRLLRALNLLAQLRTARRETMVALNVTASCGNSICEIANGESCASCPSDCSTATIHAQANAATDPCAMSAAVRVRGADTVEFGIGRRFDVTLPISPLVTHARWGTLPAGFGVTRVTLDVDRSGRSPTSVDVDYQLRVDGLGKNDVSSGLTSGSFIDPSLNGAVDAHAFAGVTFAVTLSVTQTGTPPPRMRVELDLSVWGRKIDASSTLSIWRWTGEVWTQCAGRVALDADSLQYNASMFGCFADMGNAGRQFALFVETTAVPFASVEHAYAEAIGELLVYAPPADYHGISLENQLLGLGIEADFRIMVQQSFAQVISLLGIDDSADGATWSLFQTEHLCVLTDKVPYREIGENQYQLSRVDGNTTVEITFPSLVSFRPLQANLAIADADEVVFGAIFHPNVHRRVYSNYVDSHHALNLYFKNGVYGDFAQPTDEQTTRNIRVSFEELSADVYDQYGTPERYRRCANLTMDAAENEPHETVLWTEDVTELAEPNGTTTECGTLRFSELGWFFPIVTSTTTSTTSTGTTTTSSTGTATTTTTATTYTILHDDFDGWKTNLSAGLDDELPYRTVVALVVAIVCMVLCACIEGGRYRSRIVDYESNVGLDQLHSIPMPTDDDLIAKPHESFIDFTWLGRHVSCVHYCYRSVYRCIPLGFIFTWKSLVLRNSYPLRASMMFYFITSVSIAIGTICALNRDRDIGRHDLDAMPRDWIWDMPGITLMNNTVFTQVNLTYSTLESRPDTIWTREGTKGPLQALDPIYVNGVVDGFWTAVFAIPFLFLVSYSMGKYHSYLDVLRVLSPARFRATYGAAARAMEERGLPAGFWMRRARGQKPEVKIGDDAITVEPTQASAYPSFTTVQDIKAETKRSTTDDGTDEDVMNDGVINPETGEPMAVGGFFDTGYLEMAPEPEDMEGLANVPRADRGLGWGEDSILGDDHAMSGAGKALAADNDSLLDVQTGASYEQEFTPEMEQLVAKARAWRLGAGLVTFISAVYAVVFAGLYFADNQSRTKVSQATCVAGLWTYFFITVVIYAPLFLLCTAISRSFCQANPVEGDKAVGIPDCKGVVLNHMMC